MTWSQASYGLVPAKQSLYGGKSGENCGKTITTACKNKLVYHRLIIEAWKVAFDHSNSCYCGLIPHQFSFLPLRLPIHDPPRELDFYVVDVGPLLDQSV